MKVFKIGDYVEWDCDDPINFNMNSYRFYGIRQVRKINTISSTDIRVVLSKSKSDSGYYKDRLKLVKNYIVREIIKDL